MTVFSSMPATNSPEKDEQPIGALRKIPANQSTVQQSIGKFRRQKSADNDEIQRSAPIEFWRHRLLCLAIVWLPPLAWAALIITLSLHSQQSLSSCPIQFQFPHSDKLMHLGEYGIFGVLTARAILVGIDRIKDLRLSIVPVIICASFGILDEYIQNFSPGRESSVADWVADTTGSFLGTWGWIITSRWRHVPKNSCQSP